MFEFIIPQTVVCGKGSLKKLPEIIKKLDKKKILIISDHGLDEIGVVDKISKLLEDESLEVSIFLDVNANPTIDEVKNALQTYKIAKSEAIIALGGGSPMDVAKAVAILATNEGNIIEYEGTNKVKEAVAPLIAIPTTAGTGSETTPFSVITDSKRKYKLTVNSYKIIPTYAIIDSSLIETVPQKVAAACGIDALIHAMEAYLSNYATPFSDAMAEKAMELIGKNIRTYVANRENEEAALGMILGSCFAGIAFGWARLGNIHAMSHPVSANFGVPHGVANAILMPSIFEYNEEFEKGRYKKIFDYVSENGSIYESPKSLTEELKKLNKFLGIPEKLSNVNVSEEKIEIMANDAMKSGNIAANPRPTKIEDVINLYKKAL